MRRSSGSSSSWRSAGTASRTGRPTSTCSSTSRRSRSAARGTPSISSRSAPKADDLAGLYEYHLDFPGNALNPGCGYEQWDRRLREGHEPAVYSHVATDPAHPGKLALQYWLFYTYNDWNNLHEGDWEMVQLLFDAADAEEALGEDPISVGYSQHEGAEAADWGDEKLELVDGRRPVVYPAAGSHANFFDPALYVGSSGEQGVGCDDTRGPHLELEPKVITIPSEASAASAALPVDHLRGPLGRAPGRVLQRADRPEPEGAVDRAGHLVGGLAAAGVRRADERRVRHRCDRLLLPGGRVGLAGAGQVPARPGSDAARPRGDRRARLVRRSPERPGGPLRRCAWRGAGRGGRCSRPSGRMYVERPRLFLGIGILLIPLGVVISILQAFVLGGFGLVGVDTTGEGAGALVLLLVAIGLTLTLLGLALVQAATACALDPDRRR